MIEAVQGTPLGRIIYYGFHVLGFLMVFLFNIWYGKKRSVSPRNSVVTTLIVYASAYLLIYILFWIESGFQVFGGNNIVRIFVYVPLLALPVAKWLSIPKKQMCDFIAPCICLCHGISHIGCIFVGCCHGYSASWGIYNHHYDGPAYPVQIGEALTALAIFGALVWLCRKKNYVTDGKSYPLMLVLFGSTRFLWEFARNNEKILWGCSSLAFHALFMTVVGIIWLTVLNHHVKRSGRK